jgi:hypothetical protein
MPVDVSKDFVRDVILQTTTPDIRVADEVLRNEPPISERTDIDHDLWVGPLGRETVDAVFAACRAPGWNFSPARWDYYRYSLVRDTEWKPGASLNWDHDQRLQDCLLLSRLVHPTTIATCFAARLFYREGQLVQIVPGPTQGLGAYAWVSGSPWRNWLTVSDLAEVGRLFTRYDFDKLPRRVRKALRHFLYVCFTYELEIRFTLVVTGLEALVNTHKKDVTKQFKRGLRLAGADLGVSIAEDEATEAYDYRSNFVHGQFLQGQSISKKVQDRYVHLETLLRLMVKQCIGDPQLASIFEPEAAINAAYRI